MEAIKNFKKIDSYGASSGFDSLYMVDAYKTQ